MDEKELYQKIDQVIAGCEPIVKRFEESTKSYLRTMPSEWLIEVLRGRNEVAPVGWCPRCEHEFNLADHELLLFTKPKPITPHLELNSSLMSMDSLSRMTWKPPITSKPQVICERCGQYESECKCVE